MLVLALSLTIHLEAEVIKPGKGQSLMIPCPSFFYLCPMFAPNCSFLSKTAYKNFLKKHLVSNNSLVWSSTLIITKPNTSPTTSVCLPPAAAVFSLQLELSSDCLPLSPVHCIYSRPHPSAKGKRFCGGSFVFWSSESFLLLLAPWHFSLYHA